MGEFQSLFKNKLRYEIWEYLLENKNKIITGNDVIESASKKIMKGMVNGTKEWVAVDILIDLNILVQKGYLLNVGEALFKLNKNNKFVQGMILVYDYVMKESTIEKI